jgi:hypothetical protein
MPKADATELASKKIGYNSSAMATLCRRGIVSPHSFLLLLVKSLLPTSIKQNAIFFDEASERRPWAINAKIARLLCRAILLKF